LSASGAIVDAKHWRNALFGVEHAQMESDEVRVYREQTVWLLGQLLRLVCDTPVSALAARPPAALEGNNMLAIAKHAAAVTRAYALGMGCGLEVSRDRSAEFVAEAREAAAIRAEFETLIASVGLEFEQLDPARLGARLTPEQSLYGTGTPREMSAREAIVENIRHLGVHLGEMRLTRSLVSG
jgi:hypothetical protein